MASRHSAYRRFSLAEFTQEQARARQEKLRLRLKEEKLEALRWKVGRPSAWPSPQELLGSPSLGGTGVRVDADLFVVFWGGLWGCDWPDQGLLPNYLQADGYRRSPVCCRAGGVVPEYA